MCDRSHEKKRRGVCGRSYPFLKTHVDDFIALDSNRWESKDREVHLLSIKEQDLSRLPAPGG